VMAACWIQFGFGKPPYFFLKKHWYSLVVAPFSSSRTITWWSPITG
jgi:hypothetical protein